MEAKWFCYNLTDEWNYVFFTFYEGKIEFMLKVIKFHGL